MSERGKRFLAETHHAETLDQAVELVVGGDLGAGADYLLRHPAAIRKFCDGVKTLAPFKGTQIIADIINTLLTDDEARPFVIEAELPPDLEAAKQAAIAKNTAAVVQYLKKHRDQIKPFVESMLGNVGGVRVALRFALEALRGRGTRDNFDVIKEIIEYIVAHNMANLDVVRSRIGTLLGATDANDKDEGMIEYLNGHAAFYLGQHQVLFKAKFRSRGEAGDPEPYEAASDLMIEVRDADEEQMRTICRPFTTAGIPIAHLEGLDGAAGVPGNALIKQDDLNAALRQKPPTLGFKQRGDGEYELKFPARHLRIV